MQVKAEHVWSANLIAKFVSLSLQGLDRYSNTRAADPRTPLPAKEFSCSYVGFRDFYEILISHANIIFNLGVKTLHVKWLDVHFIKH